MLASLSTMTSRSGWTSRSSFSLLHFRVDGTPDPRARNSFTLNQFNMIVSLDDAGRDVAQVHFYSTDPEYLHAMPALLRMRIARPAATDVLRHATIGLGYLPSWASPRLRAVARQPQGSELLPGLEVGAEEPVAGRIPMLQEVLRRITRAAPYLDLLPIKMMYFVSAALRATTSGGASPTPRRFRETS